MDETDFTETVNDNVEDKKEKTECTNENNSESEETIEEKIKLAILKNKK